MYGLWRSGAKKTAESVSRTREKARAHGYSSHPPPPFRGQVYGHSKLHGLAMTTIFMFTSPAHWGRAATTTHQLRLLLVLVALSVAYSIAFRRIERLRRGVSDNYVSNVLDVWTVAGALLLPAPFMTALLVAVYAAEWPSRRIGDNQGGGNPRRYVVSVVLIIAAALSGAAVGRRSPMLIASLSTVATWTVVNVILIAGVMLLKRGGARAVRRLFTPRNFALDAATKVLGIVVAGLLAWSPFSLVITVPLLMVGHREILRDAIRSTYSFDPTTNLWSEKAWRLQAEDTLVSAPGSVVLLLIDPRMARSAKQIESVLIDVLGRAAPRRRRAAPGWTIRLVLGHYGTRQVVMLSEIDIDAAGLILAKRVRERLAAASVQCIVGVAVGCVESLDELLMIAGTDLMTRRAAAGVSTPW